MFIVLKLLKKTNIFGIEFLKKNGVFLRILKNHRIWHFWQFYRISKYHAKSSITLPQWYLYCNIQHSVSIVKYEFFKYARKFDENVWICVVFGNFRQFYIDSLKIDPKDQRLVWKSKKKMGQFLMPGFFSEILYQTLVFWTNFQAT